ncbi:MAG: primosomal protein N' [Candidatus Caenarcaniphilales bacterium]|nr:primosomal protein N' [Candidatus Caenarcaniphilales bacterium]
MNNSQNFSNLLDNSLTYKIPENFEADLAIGNFVYVPILDKVFSALIIDIEEEYQTKFKIKEIIDIIDPRLKIKSEIIDLIRFTSEYYLASYSQSLDCIISSTLIPQTEKQVTVHEEIKEDIENQIKSLSGDLTAKVLSTLAKCRGSSAKFSRLRTLLKITTKQLNKEINSLKAKGLIKIDFIHKDFVVKENNKNHLQNYDSKMDSNLNSLTPEQGNAYRQINQALENDIRKFLIHGVTGSGKTEVYFQLIKDALDKNKSVIILVPEIALAPQLIERLKKKFNAEDILVWHSALEISERQHTFFELLKDQPKIVVGARSAVFTPVNKLGLIILDEEHENSYKQDQPAPRYHTRKIAEYRCEQANATLVLGSATPSLETYYKANSEKHSDWMLLTLKQRYNKNPLPEVDLIDMREEFNHGNKSIFSKKLKELLQNTLEKKEQSILFLNKRGNSSHVFCRDCGHIYKCSKCDAKMVYHSDQRRLICHLCGHEEEHPETCPTCSSSAIKYFGLGTQKLEQEVKKEFPNAKVKRLDSDVNKNKKSYLEIWRDFKNGDIDMLIGTQMIAKGLDNPNLTCVGVVAADSCFTQLDYLADEKGFQLLTQVSGRAGRKDKEGKVIFQSYQPDREALIYAQEQNYDKFYENEITNREDFLYPPFSKLVRFISSSESETTAINNLNLIHEELFSAKEKGSLEIQILGPSQCQINRINNKFRYHILVKLKDKDQAATKAIKDIYLNHKNINKSKLVIDIDSLSLF